MSWAAIGMLSGCGFSATGHPESDLDAGAGNAAPAPPSNSDPVPLTCSSWGIANDPSLRLCLDFEDAGLTANKYAADTSGYDHDAATLAVSTTTRTTAGRSQQAVTLGASSRITVAESSKLDLPAMITFGLWMYAAQAPSSSGPSVGLLSNGLEYGLSIRSDGNVVCAIGERELATEIDAARLATIGHWIHLACTFDGIELRAYVGGVLADCRRLSDLEDYDSTGGLVIGASNHSGIASPVPFIGSIDNVHIYARPLPAYDLCELNGVPSILCRHVCPQDDND